MNKMQAVKILSPLICAYPNTKITEETIQVYAVALSELTEKSLTAAVLKCMRTSTFFPSIAEIMKAADDMNDVAAGTKAKSPDESWNEVQRQMEEAFVYKKPVFSTPEIELAALSMGWIGLCETPVNQIGVARAQFLKLYDSVLNRKKEEKTNSRVLELVGHVSGNMKQIRQ